ncbi:MAG: hypothetical protein ACRDBM_00385 [Sporomusa sp.]
MVFTTTEFWMFGIIGMMILFGICAAVLSSMGKKRRDDAQGNKHGDS